MNSNSPFNSSKTNKSKKKFRLRHLKLNLNKFKKVQKRNNRKSIKIMISLSNSEDNMNKTTINWTNHLKKSINNNKLFKNWKVKIE